MILFLLFALSAAPEHEFDDLNWPEIIVPDNKCDCLEWKQVDGGYVCIRPYCPAKRIRR